MKLLELFDRILPYTWQSSPPIPTTPPRNQHEGSIVWVAKAYTSNNKIVEIHLYYEYRKRLLDISFATNNRVSVTGGGEQFQILSTVIHATEDFVKNIGTYPKNIKFEASTTTYQPELDKYVPNESRRKLYKKLVQRFATKHHYQCTIQSNEYQHTFTLTREEL